MSGITASRSWSPPPPLAQCTLFEGKVQLLWAAALVGRLPQQLGLSPPPRARSKHALFTLGPRALPRAPLPPGAFEGPASSSPGDAAVGGHDEDRRHVTLQGPVEEGEALDVQHVDLVNE